eukprot:6415324-Prymnesium_polylepis.1
MKDLTLFLLHASIKTFNQNKAVLASPEGLSHLPEHCCGAGRWWMPGARVPTRRGALESQRSARRDPIYVGARFGTFFACLP